MYEKHGACVEISDLVACHEKYRFALGKPPALPDLLRFYSLTNLRKMLQ